MKKIALLCVAFLVGFFVIDYVAESAAIVAKTTFPLEPKPIYRMVFVVLMTPFFLFLVGYSQGNLSIAWLIEVTLVICVSFAVATPWYDSGFGLLLAMLVYTAYMATRRYVVTWWRNRERHA